MDYLKLLFALWQFKKNENKTRKQLKDLQDKKLRKLLLYAYKHSKYYHETFHRAGLNQKHIQTAPLSKFPTINKKILMEHFNDIVTAEDLSQEELRQFDKEAMQNSLFKQKYHVVHSSGSTEEPGYFVYDKQAWNSMLIGIVRGALWEKSMGGIVQYLLNKPRIAYIAATDGRYGGAMAVGAGIDGIGAKQLFLDIKTPLAQWIRQLNEFQPNTVIGYPSAIKILTELAENGELHLRLNRIVSCGEPLSQSLRKTLKNLFHTEVINFYGASESIALGVEGTTADGMYLFDDMNYIEIEHGAMYFTCLYNYVQPLIRYQLSDKLTLLTYHEHDRYPFTKAKSIVGRNEDLLWFENSKGHKEFIHPLAVEGFCIKGMRDYQFRQISVDAFEMLVELSDESKRNRVEQEMLAHMAVILKEKALQNVQFYVRFTKEIAPDKTTGKKKLVVKDFKEEFVL